MVLIELLILLAAIIIIGITALAWSSAKRDFKRQGAKDAREIDKLAREVHSERSAQKCERLNQLIDAWNAKYSKEFDQTIPKVDCSPFK
jgi:hypothetical protein